MMKKKILKEKGEKKIKSGNKKKIFLRRQILLQQLYLRFNIPIEFQFIKKKIQQEADIFTKIPI